MRTGLQDACPIEYACGKAAREWPPGGGLTRLPTPRMLDNNITAPGP